MIIHFDNFSFIIFTILKHANMQKAYPHLFIPKIFVPGTVLGTGIILRNKTTEVLLLNFTL